MTNSRASAPRPTVPTEKQTSENHPERVGEVVRIVGDVGVGKSHLLATFVKEAKAADAVVAAGVCHSTHRDTAYYAGRQIARWLLGLGPLGHAPVDEQIRHVETTLTAMQSEWRLRLPVLGDLLGPGPFHPTKLRLRLILVCVVISSSTLPWRSSGSSLRSFGS